MATWLTYLRIANKIKEHIDGIELPYLMLGTIAPFVDIEMDGDLDIKDILSYNLNILNNKIDIDQKIISFKSKYIAPPLILYKSDTKRSFLWGYYFSLIISRLWRNAFPKHYSVEEFIYSYNKYDFCYIRSNGSEIINYFDSLEVNINKFDDFDMFNLLQLKNRIVKYYSIDMGRINIDASPGINADSIERFIEKSAKVCSDLLLGRISIT